MTDKPKKLTIEQCIAGARQQAKALDAQGSPTFAAEHYTDMADYLESLADLRNFASNLAKQLIGCIEAREAMGVEIARLRVERDRLREALQHIEDMALELHTAGMKPIADLARAALKAPDDD